MRFRNAAIAASAAIAVLATAPAAQAKRLSQDEVVRTMVDRPITTKRMGMTVNLRFASNGVVTAKALIGTYKGKWRRGGGDAICTTFPTGPAKGTQCVTYSQIGKNRYRTSGGTVFTVR